MPGPVPRVGTRDRTVPAPHVPGYYHTVHHTAHHVLMCRSRVSDRPTEAHQASLGYSEGPKTRICLKAVVFISQKWTVQNGTFCQKSLPNPHKFLQNVDFCHFP